jgi:RimJ/RimL family protein N-acetyltransferase
MRSRSNATTSSSSETFSIVIPDALRTSRLLLRPWRATDAAALLPVLEANVAHIGPWIPAHVATPVPLPALAERLAGFAGDFAAGRAFRFAMLTPDAKQILGEADLFPRAASGRVPLSAADHVELGYWLDAAVTGQGLATEATLTLLDVAAGLPGMTHAEIHCDAANERSAAIPHRLGFQLASTDAENQIWRKPLNSVVGSQRLAPSSDDSLDRERSR